MAKNGFFSHKLSKIGAYLLIVITTAGGMWALQRESEARHIEFCAGNIDVRQALREMIEFQEEPALDPSTVQDPELRDAIERSLRRNREFQIFVRDEVKLWEPPPGCKENPPARAPQFQSFLDRE